MFHDVWSFNGSDVMQENVLILRAPGRFGLADAASESGHGAGTRFDQAMVKDLANRKLVALLGAEPRTPFAVAVQTASTALGLMPTT
jgi:hypothetical protein